MPCGSKSYQHFYEKSSISKNDARWSLFTVLHITYNGWTTSKICTKYKPHVNIYVPHGSRIISILLMSLTGKKDARWSLVTVLHTSGWKMLKKTISIQNLNQNRNQNRSSRVTSIFTKRAWSHTTILVQICGLSNEQDIDRSNTTKEKGKRLDFGLRK